MKVTAWQFAATNSVVRDSDNDGKVFLSLKDLKRSVSDEARALLAEAADKMHAEDALTEAEEDES